MARKWPEDVKASIEAMLRAGSSPKVIRKLYASKGVECPPASTIRYWASEMGVSTGSAASAASARVQPTKAADLPQGVRGRIVGFVDRSLVYLDSDEAIENARNTKALTDSIGNLLVMIPDLLTVEEKLNPDGNSTRESRRERLSRLVKDRRLGPSGPSGVPEKSGGADA